MLIKDYEVIPHIRYEIKRILDGHDVYITGAELKKRLAK